MAFNQKGEAQVISYIVKLQDLSILESGNYNHEDFSASRSPIIKFIEDYKHKYNSLPSEETIQGMFPDTYDNLPIEQAQSYLIDTMKENSMFVQFERAWNEASEGFARGKIGMDEMLTKMTVGIETIRKKGHKGAGADITEDVSRLDRYIDKVNGIGSKSYSTGLQTMDEAFGGILPDDLVVVGGRLSHGKTWVLNLLSAIFYTQGYSILFYSGEMETDQIAYRFDSIVSGVSSGSLLWGKDLTYRKEHVDYEEHINKLKENENFFTVVTPNDFGGVRPTVKDIEKLVEDLKPDFVFIDQLSLMSDWEKAREERFKYGNITRDLRLLASNYLVPVFLAAQANREATARDDDGDYKLPEENQLAESDLVAQHATRVITLSKSNQPSVGGMKLMKMGIKKNRHGEYPEWEMMVDYDKGLFLEKDEDATLDIQPELFDLSTEMDMF